MTNHKSQTQGYADLILTGTQEQPDHTTQTLRLIVDLTGVVDKALDRVIELERKVKKLETVVDRIREMVPSVE
jgi:hypothetical protein